MDFEQNKQEKKGRRPDYKSQGGSGLWINKDKNGEQYCTVKLEGHESIAFFKNKPKEDKNVS